MACCLVRAKPSFIWTNAGILLIRISGTNFSEMLSEIDTFLFKKMNLKMSSGKWLPFCLGLSKLRPGGHRGHLHRTLWSRWYLIAILTSLCKPLIAYYQSWDITMHEFNHWGPVIKPDDIIELCHVAIWYLHNGLETCAWWSKNCYIRCQLIEKLSSCVIYQYDMMDSVHVLYQYKLYTSNLLECLRFPPITTWLLVFCSQQRYTWDFVVVCSEVKI